MEQLFTAGSAATGLASAIGGTRDRGVRPGLRACVVGVTKLECLFWCYYRCKEEVLTSSSRVGIVDNSQPQDGQESPTGTHHPLSTER